MTEETALTPEQARAKAFVVECLRREVGPALDVKLPPEGRPLVAVRLEEQRGPSLRFSLHQRQTFVTGTLDARSGEMMDWLIQGLGEGSSRAFPENVLLDAARAAGRVPEDAVLVSAGYVERRVGEPEFMAVWKHVIDGVEVQGDLINVSVNGATGKVFSVLRRWRKVDFNPHER